VTTIKDQFKGYTKKEVVNAIKARRLQGMIGGPPTEAFGGMVHEKLIDKCPVALSDFKNAQNIFGPDLAGLRGRTERFFGSAQKSRVNSGCNICQWISFPAHSIQRGTVNHNRDRVPPQENS
jgi:hypothetical protein